MSNAPERLTFLSGDFEDKFTEITDETEIENTRTDTIPARAEVAREFMESVFRSHTNANFKLPVAETMGIVLKEWEESNR